MVTNKNLPDMQATKEGFKKIPINKVGVRGIKMPLKIIQKNNETQECVVEISSYCNLVEDVKGINMSRIARTIMDNLDHSEDGIYDLRYFAGKLQKAHNTDNVYIKAKFDYLISKESPVTKIKSYEPINVSFESIMKGDNLVNFLSVKVAGMSLCPCSKEMSMLKYNLNMHEIKEIENTLNKETVDKIMEAGNGAHNQLSWLEIKVQLPQDSEDRMWIEDLVEIADNSFSCPVYSILKRPDEQYVTEKSYANPKFVEDIVREAADQLNDYLDSFIIDYICVCNNMESIHNNIKATAVLNAGRNLK